VTDVELEVDGRTIRLTSLERPVWPALGFTKRDVLDYYRGVAPVLLPHVADRPVTLARFPEGVDSYGWYQTQCRGPDWIRRRTVGTQSYCVLDGLASLLWAVNAGAVELHPLLSRGRRTDVPTGVVFDLDPGPPAGLSEAREVAVALRELLAAHGLEAVARTSGSLGLHVVVPLNSPATFEVTKAFAKDVAREAARRLPQYALDRPARADRAGRVFVDWMQNTATRSLAAPYSLRAQPEPRVATPVSWDEVANAEHLVFGPGDVLERVANHGDLHRAAAQLVQRLP
jgi:bifunctional non-homologous end joining protein LigD